MKHWSSLIALSIFMTLQSTIAHASPQLTTARLQSQTTYLRLSESGQANELGNPIYYIDLVVNDRVVGQYPAVTGRAHTQQRNRHRAGTEAPLPDGLYRIGSLHRGPFQNSEMGSHFLSIAPTFRTGRSGLGIHVDPSFNRRNGQDGTAGCIGLASQADLQRVLAFVRQHRVTHLVVETRL